MNFPWGPNLNQNMNPVLRVTRGVRLYSRSGFLATIYRFMRTNDCEHKGYVVGVVSIRMALDLDP